MRASTIPARSWRAVRSSAGATTPLVSWAWETGRTAATVCRRWEMGCRSSIWASAQRAVALALGGTASCALLEGGRVKCWGDAYQGATGHGDIEPRGDAPGTMGDNLPAVDLGTRDGAPLKVTTLEAFEYHSFCAIVDAADPGTSGLKCWGSNDYCELGSGRTTAAAARSRARSATTSSGSTSARPPRGLSARRSRWPAVFSPSACSATTARSSAGGPTVPASSGMGTLSDPRSCVARRDGERGAGPAAGAGGGDRRGDASTPARCSRPAR